METVLFVSSAFKGTKMLEAVKASGCRILLLTEEKLQHEPWPRDILDEIFFVPDLRRYQDVIHAISYLCRSRQLDLIVPLDEFEIEIVAILREHLRLPGMRVSETRRFRDKLAMREITHNGGILVPPFTHVLNYDQLRAYMAAITPPWILKPRTEAGSMGIRKVHNDEEVWRALDELGDMQSYYLLEQFIPGDIFHVDSIVVNGSIEFCSVQQYGAPPMQVYQGGGVFNSRVLPRDADITQQLTAINQQLITVMDYQNGITHAEYIRAHADGQLYFLEVAARVGGAFLSDLIEAATGVNPWTEWGRLEIARLRGKPYTVPTSRQDYAGLLITLARQEHPDLSAYNAPEVVWKADKAYHAGLILVSPDYERVETLLNEYTQNFVNDFLAVGKPQNASRTGQQG
ncbi:MAG: ATP-grasp domain-containing protein [Anaerolineales bacterium]|nr:ATP-grasp domain-containing protein [Anaerolineales bacterium]